MRIIDHDYSSELPLELILYLADFLSVHILIDLHGHREFNEIQKRILTSCGMSNEHYSNLSDEALRIEKSLGFSKSSTVLEYCIANSPIDIGEACLNFAIECETQQKSSQEELIRVASRYDIPLKSHKLVNPLQVVYGADFLSLKPRSTSTLLPIILVCDHILSDEGILFDSDEHYSKVPNDFKILKQEGILIPYSWPTLFASILYPNQSVIRDVELESEEMYLNTEEGRKEPQYAPLEASHGYATSLKLSIPSLILPGDQPPNAFYSPVRPNSLPNPELASTIWIFEALGVVLDNFAISKLPIEEILSIREKVRAGDAHSEFRELALAEIGRLKGDLRGAGFSEIREEIQFDIRTNFGPTVARLQREMAEIDRKRKRKFLSKIREEGLSLTLNILGLLMGPDRNKALLDITKTLYSSADAGLSDANVDIPRGFAFALKISKELENLSDAKPKEL